MSIIFSAYVFGDYTKYIPYYVYGITESYPDAFIKVFVHDFLPDKINLALSKINSKNFKIIENSKNIFFSKINFKKKYIKLGNERILRWLIPHDEFKNCDYAYIGDIDMLIAKENPDLIEGHINHSKLIGYPFSNIIRRGQKRLSGLHFVHVQKYYSIMNPIIKKYSKDISNFFEKNLWCDNNEMFLYEIIREGFGEYNKNFIEGKNYYRPHHGMHLGINRKKTSTCKTNDKKNIKAVKVFESKNIDGSAKYPWITENFKFKKKLEATINKIKNNLSLNKDDYYHINWINSNSSIENVPDYIYSKKFKEIHDIIKLEEINDYI